MSQSPIRAIWILLLPLALAAGAVAQTTGTIRGEVTDQQGASLAGVTITATSDSRGTSRTTVTGANGHFVLSSLSIDVYAINARREGFREQVIDDVRVTISSTVKLMVEMSLASIEEAITISSIPVLDTSSSSVGSNFTSEFIEDLPTDRNFWDLMAVSPGVSPRSEGSTRMSVFGSSTSSNSWSIDGLDTTNTDTGNSWWYINPDTVAEVQVLAIGAPAQYGKMSGAAFNVVTKSGTNKLEGSINLYYQDENMTGENAQVNGVPFHRDEFRNFTFTVGGPLQRDKVWFFGAYENARDAFSDAGSDPKFPDTFPSDRYDIKITTSLNESNLIEGKLHNEDYRWAFGDAFSTPDAQGSQFGTNPAWGVQLQSVLSSDSFLEVRYAGYSGADNWQSRTRSTADPFIDYSPLDGGPPRFSGSLWNPRVFDLSHDQTDSVLSHHADNFLQGDHDFKFGISYAEGAGDSITAGGLNGVYYYRYESYYYRVTSRPYHYGAEAVSLSAFIDDSWQVTPSLTLNVGLRFDQHSADIPDYPLLNQDWSATDETIPGQEGVIDWAHWSPRVGFVYKLGARGVLRGFYGKFYDGNVTGNWYAPPPDAPSSLYEYSTALEGPWTQSHLFEQLGTTVDPDLKAPETDQFTIGYERQFGKSLTLGIQGVYKESKNLIGWEILDDGIYEFLDWRNPFTGEIIQLASIIEQPSTRKGNGPGPGSLAAPDTKYHQEYEGAFLSLRKRHTDGWSLQASYTWSNSNGFLPRALSQNQGSPFYTSNQGRDPNNWINARQSLQNEREHVLQMQGNFDLPWRLTGTVIYSYLDGKPYSRQVWAGRTTLRQGAQTVIAIPANSDNRLPAQNVLDLALGRKFGIGPIVLKANLQLFNVFNDDANDWWQSLRVPPGSEYVPSGFILPRRIMIQLGLRF